MVDAVVLVALWFFTHYTEQQANARVSFVKRFLLEETVSSSFEVMEAALRRRLWEAPPDSNCLRSTNFRVDGSRSDLKLQWSVVANYNASTHVYDLTASGGYYSDPILKTFIPGMKVNFHKQVKVLDSSDFLMLNAGTQPVNVMRTYESSGPAGLVAGAKRIYLKGSMALFSLLYPNAYPGNWVPVGSNFNYYGIIVQGERIQVAGGIRYIPSYLVNTPDPASCTTYPGLCSTLAPWEGTRFQGQAANGAGVFFGGGTDYNTAVALNLDIKNCHNDPNCPYPGDLDMAEIKKHVYPVALFGGSSRPLLSSSANDTGAYVNDQDTWNDFLYSYSGNHWGMLADFTCLLDHNEASPECSFSEAYPKGFSRWRTNAGLDGVLFTHETADISSSPIDWDNYQALQEDAVACGKVVNAGDAPAYEDCPIWDTNFLKSFVAANGASAPKCQSVTKVSLDGSIFSNFNEATYKDDSVQDRLLRRIIYAKGPIEIAQTNVQGLRPGMPDPTERSRLTIWVVSEDVVNLRGNQAGDPTPPGPGDYSRFRRVVYNSDGTVASGGFPSMRMVIMSPELVHLISPGYLPMTSAHFLASYGVKGGYLYPKIPTLLDDSRWNADGYVYGMRSFQINNMVTISNASEPAVLLSAADGFFLKGMWSGWDSGEQQFVHNQCLFNRDGQPAVNPYSGATHEVYPSFPTLSDELGNYPVSMMPTGGTTYNPPLTSNYYQKDPDGSLWVPYLYYPYVYTGQMYATTTSMGTRESNVQYTGLRLQVNFDSTHGASQRDLSSSLYATSELASTNLADKRYFYRSNKPYYWTPVEPPGSPTGNPCARQTFYFLDGTLAYTPASDYDEVDNYYHVNFGKHVFQHTAPDGNLTDLGALFGVDLPMVETRE